jgi:hypothetical protein
MAVPDWVSYVSLAGGVIGTVSGCLAYRRTGQLKKLDLRLELRRADEDLRQLIGGLQTDLQRANTSRLHLQAVQGGVHSGATLQWTAELDADFAKAAAIEAAVPPVNADYRKLRSEQLESLLVERHRLHAEGKKLSQKYMAILEKDEQARARFRTFMTRPSTK